ncbi:hypothetical protein [Pantoea allii]|uniref:Transposase n=1 Tax=Pantoea allii TaxID=574096 RepID=A0ABS6VFI7_9GAMM|nr:hypothetical protein [Pantoea allii]MBW1214094.1 hypothetical protein [Pantoea allii]MBW1253175.1 hypothetical protein [Pantoea allii]MBW1258067.1 hypothetical protein [Pantoea allii]MBW1262729.1 hypothetical protein [Pantoea allii]MBW1267079.1 hypothetical protein [Pantoea allii]
MVSVIESLWVLNKRLLMRIQTHNVTGFISWLLDKWAHEHGVTMDFSRPGKP